MASAPVAYSSRFARAAAAERERLGLRLEQAKARARKCKGDLAAAEAEVSDLEARRATLTSLLGEAQGDPARPSGSLRGHAIRETAVEVLVDLGLVGAPMHYRRWLGLLEDAGHSVAGQRPDAVFLNQVVRHPLVRPTTRSGFYEVDLGAQERLRAQIAELRDSLAAVNTRDVGEPSGEATGPRSRDISRELSRAERRLAEACAACPLPVQACPDSGPMPRGVCRGQERLIRVSLGRQALKALALRSLRRRHSSHPPYLSSGHLEDL